MGLGPRLVAPTTEGWYLYTYWTELWHAVLGCAHRETTRLA